MTDEKKETFLSYAIKRNNNPIINLILTSPLLDLNYKDKKGNTYLHISIIQQNIKLIKALLEKGISVNEKNNDGNTALHFAYYINNIEIIKLLLNCHINPNIKNNQGLTAEEVIPTNDIDKIAGFEVDMNFDDNIYDELKYNSNENNEIYDLNKKKKILIQVEVEKQNINLKYLKIKMG
jgi:ankyrin repeat protein